jgi:hypothetical protein
MAQNLFEELAVDQLAKKFTAFYESKNSSP